ncbi:hypothetical protein J2T30_003145 [Kerstersia gyiorum]|nr:hypothetical protein [Kerstersia gyiorum]
MNGSAPLNLMSGTASSLAPCPREQFARRRAFPNGLVLDQAVFLSPGRPKTKMPPLGGSKPKAQRGGLFYFSDSLFQPFAQRRATNRGDDAACPRLPGTEKLSAQGLQSEEPNKQLQENIRGFPF